MDDDDEDFEDDEEELTKGSKIFLTLSNLF